MVGPVLQVVVSDRIEPLLDQCVDRLRSGFDDPLERSWVAVPTTGMRRWLREQLRARLGTSAGEHSDGIVAHIHMPLPPSLTSLLLGVGAVSEDASHASALTNWQVPRIAWAIYHLGTSRALPDALVSPGAHVDGLHTEVTIPTRSPVTFNEATQLALMLQRYLRYRPDMVVSWLHGSDTNALGERIAQQCQWQPVLFRSVRELLGPSPAELAHEALSGQLHRSTLPKQATFFAYTSISGDLGPALHHVAEQSDVLVQLLVPSVADFQSEASKLGRELQVNPILLRAENRLTWTFPRSRLTATPTGDTMDLGGESSLIAAWGMSSRETAVVATVADLTNSQYVDYVPTECSEPHTLLGALQNTIRSQQTGLRHIGSEHPGHNDDHHLDLGEIYVDHQSIQIHQCVGRVRQVEALRDAIFHALHQDSSLEYDDISILCPDIDLFLPAIRQVLGSEAVRANLNDEEEVQSLVQTLPYSIVDYPLSTTNEYVQAFISLLNLLQSRCGASDIESFLSNSVVTESFGWQQQELEQLAQWLTTAPVKWGLDVHDRELLVPEISTDLYTWEYGLNRLVVGSVASLDANESVAGISFPPPVQLTSDALEQLARLRRTISDLKAMRSRQSAQVGVWARSTEQLCRSFFGEPQAHEQSARRIQRVLQCVAEDAASVVQDGVADTECTLADFLRAVQQQIVDGLNQNVRRPGSVLITSMAPNQRVPSRIVAILGLDEDALPRANQRGDDLVAIDPFVGDLDTRSEFRQQLLSCILSAEEQLIITSTSIDRATNNDVPPPPILNEFVEFLSSILGKSVNDTWSHITYQHSRHAYELQNFQPNGFASGISGDSSWSADPIAFAAAQQLRQSKGLHTAQKLESPRVVPRASADQTDARVLEVQDLITAIAEPLNTFMREGLGGYVDSRSDTRDDDLPVSQNALEAYQLRTDMTHRVLSGASLNEALREFEQRGQLPPAVLSHKDRASLEEYATKSLEYLAGTLHELGVSEEPLVVDQLESLLVPLRLLEAEIDLSLHSLETGDDKSVGRKQKVVGSFEKVVRNPVNDRAAVVEISGGSRNLKREIRTRIELMYLTIVEPNYQWFGIHVVKASPATVFAFKCRGDDSAERKDIALKSLSRLVELYHMIVATPVPATPDTSSALASGSNDAEKAWEGGYQGAMGERYDAAVQLIFGDHDLESWKLVTVGDVSPVTAAHQLWAPLDEATEEIPAGNDAKKRRKKS